MSRISPNPSLPKRGTFFVLALILANQRTLLPFLKGGWEGFLLKVSPLVRLFDGCRIVSAVLTQLTQGRKYLAWVLSLLLCLTRIRLSTTYPPCLSTMHTLAGFFCLKFVISHP